MKNAKIILDKEVKMYIETYRGFEISLYSVSIPEDENTTTHFYYWLIESPNIPDTKISIYGSFEDVKEYIDTLLKQKLKKEV